MRKRPLGVTHVNEATQVYLSRQCSGQGKLGDACPTARGYHGEVYMAFKESQNLGFLWKNLLTFNYKNVLKTTLLRCNLHIVIFSHVKYGIFK